MKKAEEAEEVIRALDGKIVKGRPIIIRHYKRELDEDNSTGIKKRPYIQPSSSSSSSKSHTSQHRSGVPPVMDVSNSASRQLAPGEKKSTRDIEEEIRRLQNFLKKKQKN